MPSYAVPAPPTTNLRAHDDWRAPRTEHELIGSFKVPEPAAPGSEIISGPMALTEPARQCVSRIGEYLKQVPPDDPRALPPAYELVEKAQEIDDQCITDASYLGIWPHAERMATYGMEPGQIAARLGIPYEYFRQMLVFSDLAFVIRGGRARGIHRAAATIAAQVAAGSDTASQFFLRTRAGWRMPSDKSAPAVTINIGGDPASVDMQEIEDLKARQAALFAEIAEGTEDF